MTTALCGFDNNKFGIDYYKALAWGGLEGTNYYQNKLTSIQRLDINDKTIQVLANRSKEACYDR